MFLDGWLEIRSAGARMLQIRDLEAIPAPSMPTVITSFSE